MDAQVHLIVVLISLLVKKPILGHPASTPAGKPSNGLQELRDMAAESPRKLIGSPSESGLLEESSAHYNANGAGMESIIPPACIVY